MLYLHRQCQEHIHSSGKMELMLQQMKTEQMVEVKDEIMEMKSAVNAEMMVLKAEVVNALPCQNASYASLQDMGIAPPTRIIHCKMGHKLCESCHDTMVRSGRRNCLGHCNTGFTGRELGRSADLQV